MPSLATFSRFFQKIAETDSLQILFSAFVVTATQDGIILGEVVAIDASAINFTNAKRFRIPRCG